jgi:large subunit ribosomal protein L10
MNRQEKEQAIQSLRDDFKNSQASFVVEYQGMTVAQVLALRRKLRAQGGTLKVAKTSLMRRVATENTNIEGLSSYLKNQVALVFAQQESPAVAKVLCDFAKEHKQLSVVAGYVDSVVMSSGAISILASLPSKEILFAQLCGTLKAPSMNLVNVLNMLIVRLLCVLKEIEKTKVVAE